MIDSKSKNWKETMYKDLIYRICHNFWKYLDERRLDILIFPKWKINIDGFYIPSHNINHILYPNNTKRNPYYQSRLIELIPSSDSE